MSLSMKMNLNIHAFSSELSHFIGISTFEGYKDEHSKEVMLTYAQEAKWIWVSGNFGQSGMYKKVSVK